jgi:hypothetical protein
MLVSKDLALELMYGRGSNDIVVSYSDCNVVFYDCHIIFIWIQWLL